MDGKSHRVMNGLGALILNNVLYDVLPRPLPAPLEQILHAVGAPLPWQDIAPVLLHPTVLVGVLSFGAIYKLTYYALSIAWARLPDIDHPTGQFGWLSSLLGGHRGCTHSCLAVFFWLVLALGGSMMLGSWSLAHHLTLSPLILREGFVIIVTFIVAWIFHLVADSLTKDGIPIWWPDPKRYGFPWRQWRFLSGSLTEYFIVILLVLLTGLGIGLGVLGL